MIRAFRNLGNQLINDGLLGRGGGEGGFSSFLEQGMGSGLCDGLSMQQCPFEDDDPPLALQGDGVGR